MKLIGKTTVEDDSLDTMQSFYEAKMAFSFTATKTLKVNAGSPLEAAQKLRDLADRMSCDPGVWNFPDEFHPFIDVMSVGKAGGLGGYQTMDPHAEGWLKTKYKELGDDDAQPSRKALV
jgi:hypothetical protein